MNFVPNTTGVAPEYSNTDTVIVDLGFNRYVNGRDIRIFNPDQHYLLEQSITWDTDITYPVLNYAIIHNNAHNSWLDELYDYTDDYDLVFVQLRNRDTNDTVTLHRRDRRVDGSRWFRSKNSYADLEAVQKRFPSSQYFLSDFATAALL